MNRRAGTRQDAASPIADALRQIARTLDLLADHVAHPVPTASTPGPDSRLHSVDDAAARLGISSKGVRRLIARGELPARRIGARVLIPTEALAAYTSGEAAS